MQVTGFRYRNPSVTKAIRFRDPSHNVEGDSQREAEPSLIDVAPRALMPFTANVIASPDDTAFLDFMVEKGELVKEIASWDDASGEEITP